jgi:hypothetical protein
VSSASSHIPEWLTRRKVLALLPILTAGLAAWVPPVVVGLTSKGGRRIQMFATTAVVGVLIVIGAPMLTSVPTGQEGDYLRDDIGFAFLLLGVAVGTACAFLIRPAGQGAHPPRPAPAPHLQNLPGVGQALARRQLRQQYQTLAADDPALAADIGVGRPDQPRQVDDGGLLDLNALDAAALQQHARLSAAEAACVVEVRQRMGRLSSVDELVVHGQLPFGTAERLREYAVFLS